MIGKLPRPEKGFVLPSHKYTGPYNPLEKQIDSNNRPRKGEEPFNGVDNISMHPSCSKWDRGRGSTIVGLVSVIYN